MLVGYIYSACHRLLSHATMWDIVVGITNSSLPLSSPHTRIPPFPFPSFPISPPPPDLPLPLSPYPSLPLKFPTLFTKVQRQ